MCKCSEQTNSIQDKFLFNVSYRYTYVCVYVGRKSFQCLFLLVKWWILFYSFMHWKGIGRYNRHYIYSYWININPMTVGVATPIPAWTWRMPFKTEYKMKFSTAVFFLVLKIDYNMKLIQLIIILIKIWVNKNKFKLI